MKGENMERREFIQKLGLAGGVLLFQNDFFAMASAPAKPRKKPNIVWIMLEDWCPDLSCYGTKGVHTPNIDKLASEGVLFTNAFTTAPVCSASRSAMMTGHFQNYNGGNQHRTARDQKKPLPHGIKPIPHILEEAGYYTAVGCGLSRKTDCNFTTPRPLFMGKHWKTRKDGQLFYAQITEPGTHRPWNRDPDNPIDAKDVELPPYYPDVPIVRRDWANGLEQAQLSDKKVGKILQELKDDGLEDNTIVFLIGDHGRCMPRGKQFLYDGGIRIPMIVRWPGKIKPATRNDDLVMSIDISRTILDAAGVKAPHPLHGKNLFDEDIKDRKYVFAARDKMDNTHDAIRAIRSKEFKYIHNLMPERPYAQFNAYKEASYPTLAVLNVMHLKGQLNPAQAAFMAAKKPEEELYDLKNDPHETVNLETNPKYDAVKKEMRAELDAWRKRINDKGVAEAFRQGGWPATYPTKTLEQWEAIVEKWKPWVFRKPTEKAGHPRKFIAQTEITKTSQ
jgi:arylsulfatase A-like enzyme